MRKASYCAIVIIFFLSLYSIDTPELKVLPIKISATPAFYHSIPIEIDGDEELGNFVAVGNGSKANPYRITGLNITANDSYFISTGLIKISNTESHLIIENNFLNANDLRRYGIYLIGCSNIQINNNTLINPKTAIYCINTRNLTIDRNNITICAVAIAIRGGDKLNITNNHLKADVTGISLENTHSNIIKDNIITQYRTIPGMVYSIQRGISLDNVFNSSIYRNFIAKCQIGGIYIEYLGENLLIFNNTLEKTSILAGQETSYTRIENNTIYGSLSPGIQFKGWKCENNTIENNIISKCKIGINLGESSKRNSIIKNYLFSNNNTGILLGENNDNTITHNLIQQTLGHGIVLEGSTNTDVTFNTFFNNTGLGVYIPLFHSSFGDILLRPKNTISKNNFMGNNPAGGSQALDDCATSVFDQNFWDEWTSPDENLDGIVDSSYSIWGTAEIQDKNPMVQNYSISHKEEIPNWFRAPTLIFPNGHEQLSGTVTIQWIAAFDLQGHAITYIILFSGNGGYTWQNLSANLTTTSFIWDTTVWEDSPYCKLKIIANNGYNTKTEFTNKAFSIINNPSTSQPSSTSTIPSSLPTNTTAPDTGTLTTATETTTQRIDLILLLALVLIGFKRRYIKIKDR